MRNIINNLFFIRENIYIIKFCDGTLTESWKEQMKRMNNAYTKSYYSRLCIIINLKT